jgi:hypothetical protein
MFSAIFSFFSSFNPIVFAAVLGVGAAILVRKPHRPVALRSAGSRHGASKSSWRHI